MENNTAPSTIPTLSFGQYLKSQMGNHLMLFGIILVVATFIVGGNYIRDLRQEMANQARTTDTLSQKFDAINQGKAAIAANTQATPTQVDAQATLAFGATMMGLMKGQDATINSLSTMVGQTQSQLAVLAAQKATFTPAQQSATTGALTGYPLEQTRTGGPALASLNLFYDPTQRDPNLALKGTTWNNYAEQFTASAGNWVKQSDGSQRTTVSLQRTVTKPNPSDPTKPIVVGTESIPLTGATTVFTPKGLIDPSTLVIPRWTASFGVSEQPGVSGYLPAASIDYRVTDRFGVFAGAVNKAGVAGISIRLGGSKK